MKDEIFEIIKNHPGLRKREIAGYLHISHLNKDFMRCMRELEMIDNKIYYVFHHDSANLEFYDKWYIVE